MNAADDPHRIPDLETLAALYGEPGEASIRKEVDHLHPYYRALIEAAPFAVLATAGPEGLDASPRGDAPGFVVVEDERTLLLPDRRGNNRVDSLRNVIRDPRVALLFLVPGIGETLRVNGRAHLSVAPRPAGALRGRRQAATLGAGGAGRDRLFPVLARGRALGAVGPDPARAAGQPAVAGHDPGRVDPGRHRRPRLRPCPARAGPDYFVLIDGEAQHDARITCPDEPARPPRRAYP